MTDTDKANALDWLNEIVTNPKHWRMFYSDSETKTCAEAAISLLKEQETEFVYDEYVTPICKECGFHPFVGYIPTIKWMQKRGYKVCPGCGRMIKWNV